MFTRRTYLDWAAGVSGNPSSPHTEGRRARTQLEEARRDIARLIEVQPDDVIFTSGATEANALAILGVVRAYCSGKAPHVLYLPSAHASIIENVRLLANEGVAVEALPIKDCRVNTEALAAMLRPETVLVTMEAVCGETGVVWNTREVAEVLKKARSGNSDFITAPSVLLHVDASQAPLTEKIARAHFGADLLTFDAAKASAVRGIGALIAHRTIPLAPLYGGGGQERGLRPGSEAPALAARFAEALLAAAASREAFCSSAVRMRCEFIAAIIAAIPDVLVNEGRVQAPNIVNLSLPGRDTDYLVMLLDEAGFAVSTRSACESDSDEGSRAVYVLFGDRERARTTLRISWGPRIRPRALVRFARSLVRAVPLSSGRESTSDGIDNEGRR